MVNCKLKRQWINIEMEHAHNFPKNMQRKIAEEIACDHVKELGPEYYPNLIRMEKRLKRK